MIMVAALEQGYPVVWLALLFASAGVFRDMTFYVDLLCAQIYADYICEQGGAFLRTDFASEQDVITSYSIHYTKLYDRF